MIELFVEIQCEEIPARFQKKALMDLERLTSEALEKASLNCESIKTFITPRRLALVIKGLPETTPASQVERKGPRVDAPEGAIQGFLKSTGLSLEACVRQETPKGTFLIALMETPARATKDVLPALLEDLFVNFPWPQTMRWGTGTKGWVRPIHSLIALLDGNILPMTLAFGEHKDAPRIEASNLTKGHRFLAPAAFPVKDADDYMGKLSRAQVMIDQEARRARIQEQLKCLAHEKNLSLQEDAGLLEEVTGLVEWPVACLGRIDEAFMALPREVLTTSMRVHQRYFSFEDDQGNLAPYFGFVANTTTKDKGALVVQGNERVLKARLSDALFFYNQDQKIPLEEHAKKLSNITFHARLGTLAQKIERLEKLAAFVAENVGASPEDARLCSRLCKADLVTGMVYEFPELQGIMGSYYAKAQGMSGDVCQAIAQHYQPRGPQDPLAQNLLGKILSLVDRLDTLVGFFAIEVTPSGSGDPFALRRAALGVIRLLEERTFSIPLEPLLAQAYDLYETFFAKTSGKVLPREKTLENLKAFFVERLKVSWKEHGLRHDQISAVLRLEAPLWSSIECGRALKVFLEEGRGTDLLSAYRRGTGIVRIEEEKDKVSYLHENVDPGLFESDQERLLFETITHVKEVVQEHLKQSDFGGAMNVLSQLCDPIHAFFEKVSVNVEKSALRRTRLALLAQFKGCIEQVADFSTLEDF